MTTSQMKRTSAAKNLPLAIIAGVLAIFTLLAVILELIAWKLSPYVWLFENSAPIPIALAWFFGSASVFLEIAAMVFICILAFRGHRLVKVLVFVLIGIYLASDVLTFISGYLWDSDGYVKWWFDFRFFGRFDSYEPLGTLGTLLRGVLTKICLATMLVFALIPRRSQSFSSSPNLTPLSTQSFTPESPTTRSTGKFCTACGATVALGTAFCGKCGAALS